MTLRRILGAGDRRVRAFVGAAVLAVLVQGPGLAPTPLVGAGDPGISGPSVPRALPTAPRSGAWGAVGPVVVDGWEPTARHGPSGAGSAVVPRPVDAAGHRVRSGRLVGPAHGPALALLRAGVADHATALPPPPPSRSPRRS